MKLKPCFLVYLCWFVLFTLDPCLVTVSAQTNTNPVTVTAEVQTTNGVRSVTAKVRTLEREVNASFGLDGVPELQRNLFGSPLWKYAASAIFVLLALCVAKILDWIIGGRFKKWAEGRASRLPGLLLNLLHGPIKVVSFVIVVHIGLDALAWPASVESWLKSALVVFVAWSLSFMVLKSIDVLIDYWQQRTPTRDDRVFNDQLFPVINKTLKVFIIIVAILVTCQNLGLNITTMLASLSIGGLALGLAAQDTVANLFGAVAVFVDKPFRVGDRIKLDSIDGVVESIGLRSTRVRSLDGFLITVPNKTMGNATITNVTRRPNIKTEMNIGITYDTSAQKVKRALEILDDVYRKHPMTQDLIIGFNKFADSSLNLNVTHWWKSTDHRAYVAGMQELHLTVKQRFDAEGIEFAFPTQTLYVKQDSSDGHAAELAGSGPAPAREGSSSIPTSSGT
jgi:MscS family membrane protein